MASGDIYLKEAEQKYKRVVPTCLIKQLVTLLNDQSAEMMKTRIIDMLDDLLYALPCGYWAVDVMYATELLEHLIKKSLMDVAFHPYVHRYFELCAKPLLLIRSDDVLRFDEDIIEYFSFFGYIMVTVRDTTVHSLVVRTLWSLLDETACHPMNALTRRCTLEAMEKSSLATALANLMDISDDEPYKELLGICGELADISEVIALQFFKENLLENVLLRLNPNFREELQPYVELHVNTVSNLEGSFKITMAMFRAVKAAPGHILGETISPRLPALASLRYALQILTFQERKRERNFLMSLFLQIMDFYKDLKIVMAGLAEDVCILSVTSEIISGGSWAHSVNFTPNVLDFEFKRMCLMGLYYCSSYSPMMTLFKETNVIQGLLKMIAPEISVAWCPEHICSIRLMALVILERVMSRFYRQFLQANGLVKVLVLLDVYTVTPYSLDILVALLKLLYRVLLVSPKLTVFNQFEEHQAVHNLRIAMDILLGVPLNGPNQRAASLAVSILTMLSHQKDEYMFENVYVVVRFLTRVLDPLPLDMRYEPELMVSMLHLTWEMCRLSQNCLELFLRHKGIYLLLDVITHAIFPVRIVGLGLLVDLTEEGSGIPYLITWRNNKTVILSLLLDIFREENKMLGVASDFKGVIEDPEFPIMGTLQKSLLSECTDTSPAITDMECSCRPKVYAILQLLNYRHREKVEMLNDYYKLYGFHMTIKDRITYLICDNYLAFKLGEAWYEVNQFFEVLNLKVVSFDRCLLDTILLNYRNWGLNVQDLQRELLNFEYKQENLDEEEFYNLMRESKLGNALDALNTLRSIARCTEAIFRLAAKLNDSFLVQNLPHAHRSYDNQLSVSNVFKQKIQVESDVIIDLFKEQPPIPASPITETTFEGIKKYFERVDSTISIDIPQECLNAENQDKR